MRVSFSCPLPRIRFAHRESPVLRPLFRFACWATTHACNDFPAPAAATEAYASTASWKARTSNFGPSAASASRSAGMIVSSPGLPARRLARPADVAVDLGGDLVLGQRGVVAQVGYQRARSRVHPPVHAGVDHPAVQARHRMGQAPEILVRGFVDAGSLPSHSDTGPSLRRRR